MRFTGSSVGDLVCLAVAVLAVGTALNLWVMVIR